MPSGACDACHETLCFDDHVAGMTVRCKQCGQGWVRIPPTAGITAAVPGFAEKGSTSPPDTAVTDQRPMTISLPLKTMFNVLPWALFVLASLMALDGWQCYEEQKKAFAAHEARSKSFSDFGDKMARRQVKELGAQVQKLKEEKAALEKKVRAQ